MGCLGNILWFLFGGLWTGLSWVAAGVLWCITIVCLLYTSPSPRD